MLDKEMDQRKFINSMNASVSKENTKSKGSRRSMGLADIKSDQEVSVRNSKVIFSV